MIAVIDIGLSNVSSVCRALARLRVDSHLTADPHELAAASRLILPGVGSFAEAARRLESTGLRELIRELVLGRGKPILGICLGMQLLASEGEEHGESRGIGLFQGRVRRLDEAPRLPHIGWNEVHNHGTTLLEGTPDATCFYFVHSYAVNPGEPLKVATSDYGGEFVAVVQKGHIMGTQFHPEKSQSAGLALLRRFATHSWTPCCVTG